jgi:hypothetical protein
LINTKRHMRKHRWRYRSSFMLLVSARWSASKQ